MFSKLPQSLSSPFGILGDEAKLRFRSQPTGIAKLANSRSIPESDAYWEQFFALFDTPSDVYSLVTPNDIRRALFEAPENVATLVRVVTNRLFALMKDHTFPSSPVQSVTSLANSFMKSRASLADRNATKEVLNCLRVLQRVFPVLFEIDGERNVFEAEVLWKKEEIEVEEESSSSSGVLGNSSTEASQFVIEDDDEDEDEEDEAASNGTPAGSTTPSPATKEKKVLPSLAEKLMSTLLDLLFCCGFTLPTKVQTDHHKINYTIWEKGVGSTVDLGSNQAYDQNKIEVLRLLLVLLSRQIYVPSGALLSKPSLYTLHLAQSTPRRTVLTVLCSLLNTAMNGHYQTTIGGLTGKLPYNHLVLKGEDSRSVLIGMSLQTLCAVLDFQSGSARDPSSGSGGPDNLSASPTAGSNAFRYFMAKLHRTQDLTFILDGIVSVLQENASISANLLPGAHRPVPYLSDIAIFLWKMLELNKKFRAHVVESDRGMDLIAYVLLYALDIKDKPAQHGMCRALSYILQTLSAEPTIGPKLASPLKITLPAKWQASGSCADFLINAIYSIVTTASGAIHFPALHPAFIITLANCGPHFRNLNVTSSTRLMQLFTTFSNPLFVLSDEGYPRLVFFMLEAFNSIIQHRFSDNPNVIYSILMAHKNFEDLATFTLSRGLRDIRRAQQQQSTAKEVNNVGGRDPLDNAERGQEKSVPVSSSVASTPPRTSESRDGSLSRGSPSLASRGDADVSAKVRGKMKAAEPSQPLLLDIATERLVAAGVGRNGFVPTQEWVSSWQQGLPLDTILLVISDLLPKVRELQASQAKANSASGIRYFLSSVTLDHVLPPTPTSPSPRRFTWSDASIVWLTSLIWGDIYVRHMTPLGVWNGTNVRLFHVKHAQSQQRLTETVSQVMVGFLGRGNANNNSNNNNGSGGVEQ